MKIARVLTRKNLVLNVIADAPDALANVDKGPFKFVPVPDGVDVQKGWAYEGGEFKAPG